MLEKLKAMGNIGRAVLTGLILILAFTSFSAATLEYAFTVDEADSRNLVALRVLPGGYINTNFNFDIEVRPDLDKSAIAIQTSFNRTLQYTLSTVEGRILSKGKVIREAELNVSRLAEGSYVMYFFRGHRVVKAILLDRV